MDFEFVLKDRNGALHRYQGEYHDFESEAAKLALQLSTLCAEPLALLMGGLSEKDGEIVDPAKVPDIISGVSGILGKLDLSHWLPEIFKHTKRDGVLLSEKDARKAAFNGNLSEATQALVKVIEYNDFLPWLDMLKSRLQSTKTSTAQ